MKKIFLLLLIGFGFSSCEKDDICDETTPTTPRLVLQFYDVTNPTTVKNVNNLKVIAPGFTDGITYNGLSKVLLPLRVNQDTTTYNFIQNGADNDATNDNTDVVTINYTRENVFVSRACGYKTVFTLNSPGGFVRTDNPAPDTLWMQNTVQSNNNINSENEIHVKVYF